VALDRQSIEKQDFPLGRRGYDQEAVDAHLSTIAEEVEALKRSAGGSAGSLASSAGEQVRAIVEAAETTAGQIRADAEREAEQLIVEARKELESARQQAAKQATEQLSDVAESAATMLELLDALGQEVGTLQETVRGGATRLRDDLPALQSKLRALGDSVAAPAVEDVVVLEEAIVVTEDEEPGAAAEEAREAEAPVAVVEAAPAGDEEEGAAEASEEDLEGARLIALNMALNGSSREEIDSYLDENFDLSNRKALLDEVYASVEG